MEKPGKPRKFLAATVGGLTLVLLVGVIGWMIWSAVATTVHEWNERAVKNAEAIKVAQAEMQHRAAMKVPLATITHDAPTDANAANAINAAVPAASPAPIPLATISGMAPSASKNDLPLAATSAPQTSSSPKPLSLATVGAMPLTKPNQASELATVATSVTNELTGKVPQAVVSSSVASPDASKIGMAVVAPSLPSKASPAEAVKLANVGTLPNPKELPAVATAAPLSIGNGKPNPLAAVASPAKETPASPLNVARLTPPEASKSILEPTPSPTSATAQPSAVPLATIRPTEAFNGRLDVARVGRRDPEQAVMESLGKLGKLDPDTSDVPLATVSEKDADQLWQVIPGMSEVQLVDTLGRPVPKTLDIPLATVSESDPENALKPVPGAFVMSLCTDLQGNLWAGCEEDDNGGGGVWRKDAATGKWTQFTVKDGLGDDNGYAVTCDQQGRIWAGHLNHGVSVYNGQKWQCYEVVGGLSRPDTLSGPLGERVFAIKVCPTDGDVWIATNCGLARYSPKSDNWSYLTRADGLPSDQASSMAFDAEGNIYLGTQCDGLAIAQAKDNYKTWRQVKGPDEMPTSASGEGLPTNLINDVLVMKDGTLFVATTTGLAESHDRGETFKYWRGRNYAAKVKGRYEGQPAGWQPAGGALLREDYVTCLGEGNDGMLMIGYWSSGFECIEAKTGQRRVAFVRSSDAFVTCINSNAHTSAETGWSVGFLGQQGDSVVSEGTPTTLVSMEATRTLPRAAPPLNAMQLRGMSSKLLIPPTDQVTAERSVACFESDDWMTQGDWVGRYGRSLAVLAAMTAPWDSVHASEAGYALDTKIGPNHAKDDQIRRWIHWLHSKDRRVLYDPGLGHRRQAEWDDHGEVYPRSFAGPDLWLTLKVPAGTHRVSMYFYNKDGHDRNNRFRDYLIEVHDGEEGSGAGVLATARVRDFWGGVHKRFIVSGPGTFRVRISDNYSHNTICSSLFVDRLDASAGEESRPLVSMGNLMYRQPARHWDLQGFPKVSRPAVEVFDAVMTRADAASPGTQSYRRSSAIAVLRAAPQRELSVAFVEAVRWHASLWNESDRLSFDEVMGEAWSASQKLNNR